MGCRGRSLFHAGSQGIVVVPDRNQTVPFSSDANVTYSCTVDGGRSAVWQVNGRQIVGDDQIDEFAESGFFVEIVDRRTSIIRVSGEARRNATQKDPPGVTLLCVAVRGLTGVSGRRYFIITFGEPLHGLVDFDVPLLLLNAVTRCHGNYTNSLSSHSLYMYKQLGLEREREGGRESERGGGTRGVCVCVRVRACVHACVCEKDRGH